MAEEEKRMIEGYEVKYAIKLTDAEVIFAENLSAEMPYLVCGCSWNNPFSLDEYKDAVAGDDPVEMLREFATRLTADMDSIEEEREERDIPFETLKRTDCRPDSMSVDLEGSVIVIKPEKLSPVYRTVDHQLALCTGGNGSRPEARGRAVFCTNLYTGKSSRWERQDIAGIILPERMPDWAQEKLTALQKPAEKESVIDKLRQGKQEDKGKNETIEVLVHSDKANEDMSDNLTVLVTSLRNFTEKQSEILTEIVGTLVDIAVRGAMSEAEEPDAEELDDESEFYYEIDYDEINGILEPLSELGITLTYEKLSEFLDSHPDVDYTDWHNTGITFYLKERTMKIEKAANMSENFLDGSQAVLPKTAVNEHDAGQKQDATFSIYQLKNDDSTWDFRFEPFDRLKAAGLVVDRANYECIYTAPVTAETDSLEKIFRQFNINHPQDFTGHSLSVSDVVAISRNGQQTAHYVDSIGFKEITGFFQSPPQKSAEKESVVDKIRQGKQAAEPKKTAQKKHDKGGPEL